LLAADAGENDNNIADGINNDSAVPRMQLPSFGDSSPLPEKRPRRDGAAFETVPYPI
jgi:hypothetical protein